MQHPLPLNLETYIDLQDFEVQEKIYRADFVLFESSFSFLISAHDWVTDRV